MNVKKVLIGTSALVVLSGCSMLPGGTATTTEELEELGKAVESGASAHCTMTDDQGSVVEYEVKGEKARVTGMVVEAAGVSGNMINDGEYVYIWGEDEKTGTKMQLPSEETVEDIAEAAEDYMDEVPNFDSEEVISDLEDEGYAVECKKTGVSDSRFVPPADVEFTDLAEVFGGMMEGALEGFGEGMGEGMTPEMQEKLDSLKDKMGE